MFNSYKTTFGDPQGEPSDELVDLEMEIFSQNDFGSTIEGNAKTFSRLIEESGLTLSGNDKAHLLDMCFNSANENFYELEEEDENFDSQGAQEDFLEAVELALLATGK
jgi:hypothetical protein